MPIINSTIPYLAHDDIIEYRDQNVIFQVSDFVKHQYYWVEYSRYDSLKNLHKVIPENILNRIKNDNVTLVLYHSHEANTNVVEPLYQHAIIELGIPEEKLHLYTESPTIKSVMLEVAKKLGRKPLRCFQTTMFERFVKDGMNYIQALRQQPIITLESKKYDKKFLNFNRRWRWHRPSLVAHMCLEGILDKGYVSLGPCDHDWGWEKAWHIMLRIHSHHPELRQRLIDNKNKIFSIPSLYLDQEDLHINHVHVLETTFDLYRNSYFSVVTETNFFKEQEPALFFTEKIFKSIAHKHPFVVLGRPGTLSFLKDIGYKTFDSIIDESYDTEEDDITRLMKILNEIKRLSSLSESQLEDFLVQAREICEYNYNMLINKRIFIREITNDPRY